MNDETKQATGMAVDRTDRTGIEPSDVVLQVPR